MTSGIGESIATESSFSLWNRGEFFSFLLGDHGDYKNEVDFSLWTVLKRDESTDFALQIEVGGCHAVVLENILARDSFCLIFH